MQPRIDYRKYGQEPLKSLYDIENYLSHSGLDLKLLLLIKMRASQINGCAFCLDMHSIDARAEGESEQRLYTLNAWRETPFFNDRERAALAWTEAATNVSETHMPDEVFAEVKKHFSEKEIVDLTLAVAMINLWNRVAISLRSVPGHYRPSLTMSTPSSTFEQASPFTPASGLVRCSCLLHRRPRLARNLSVGFSPTQPSLRSLLRP